MPPDPHGPTTTVRPRAGRDDASTFLLAAGPPASSELAARYHELLADSQLDWVEHHRVLRRLGEGGQGVVVLAERRGADGFRLPVALKAFAPGRYEDDAAYAAAMAHMAGVALRVAQIQQDNLIDVQNFVAPRGVRVLEMEWIDGFDLRRLLTPAMLREARRRVDEGRWAYLNEVIVTDGPMQPRLKPGIAVAVLRGALTALSALHRAGLVHGDVKPANLMLKRTGAAKLIDIGSAFAAAEPPSAWSYTPGYAAPEVHAGSLPTARSDLASLGYVLVEMLAGRRPFAGLAGEELTRAKAALPDRLGQLLPAEVVRNELLMGLVRGLVAADPGDRFPGAAEADLDRAGAAEFQRQLVRGGLASEYGDEIRAWLGELE